MRSQVSWGQIVSVVQNEYIKWLTNGKLILLPVLVVMIREIVILPILAASEDMEQPINILEPCIAQVNSGIILLLIPLVYLVLIADFPSVDGNTYYLIPRIGRRNWILGEILFQLTSLSSYLLFLILSTMLQVIHCSFFANGWSLVVTDYATEMMNSASVSMAELIPLNLYFQMSPANAFWASYGFVFLFLFLCGQVLLWSALYGKKLIGFWGVLSSIAVGIALCSAKIKWMWLFPVCHSILWIHYQDYYREYVFSPWLSLLLFVVFVITFFILILRKAKKMNLDILREGHE